MLYIIFKLFVGSETIIYPAVVYGLVAVALGLKQRTDIDRCASDLFGVIRPGFQLLKVMSLLAVVFVGTAAKSQRINVIENGLILPCHRVKQTACGSNSF